MPVPPLVVLGGASGTLMGVVLARPLVDLVTLLVEGGVGSGGSLPEILRLLEALPPLHVCFRVGIEEAEGEGSKGVDGRDEEYNRRPDECEVVPGLSEMGMVRKL